ncbi:MAG: hypothetical protein GY953_00875 [bacterium]|nr:hypothetical protein [bacterium]
MGAREIAAIRDKGIRRIELLIKDGCFDYRDRAQMAEVLAECGRQGVSVVSVHGALTLDYRTEDEEVRESVMRETLSTVRFAEEAGASVFVAHFGFNKNARRTVTELLEHTRDLRVALTTETMGGDATLNY